MPAYLIICGCLAVAWAVLLSTSRGRHRLAAWWRHVQNIPYGNHAEVMRTALTVPGALVYLTGAAIGVAGALVLFPFLVADTATPF